MFSLEIRKLKKAGTGYPDLFTGKERKEEIFII